MHFLVIAVSDGDARDAAPAPSSRALPEQQLALASLLLVPPSAVIPTREAVTIAGGH
ncbi:hypothetical protein TRIATDRAFT_305920 [Trichoderma atroviride IMI 206040]|uniref:Uncharacterized protein n=1 Tax=Hypocrea atroviridis (strain ATCC 20476 / IMI 206040) TaxID=452589 RepID=G9NMP8_HYPAI|nr:uncharacterized protein TRIATDRAFT_305920 [Trichoderma atroviride IMI 206040]EHK48178.1 hypothetical protein TRIATDRAFT_305920 [Trichoderma atroviride IMI 206040]